MEAYAGIDLAFRKGKPLPVVVCLWRDGHLQPLSLRAGNAPPPPRGLGNPASLDPASVHSFVDDTARYLHRIEDEFGLSIRRIAIDAPSSPRRVGQPRRKAELALDRSGIRCIPTPDAEEFDLIRKKAKGHLAANRPISRMPHANQLWMLVGFQLFNRLGAEWECIEVYPQATVHFLGAGDTHKSSAGGVVKQLTAAARYTRWPECAMSLEALGVTAYGALHDKLDAYLAAWVASLPVSERKPLGDPPDDVIWIPKCVASMEPDSCSAS